MNAVDFNILLVNFIYSKAKGENCFNAEQGKKIAFKNDFNYFSKPSPYKVIG